MKQVKDLASRLGPGEVTRATNAAYDLAPLLNNDGGTLIGCNEAASAEET